MRYDISVSNETETGDYMELTQGHRQRAAESFLFQDVPAEGLDWALARGELVCAGRGEMLYSPDRFRHSLGLVLSGRVRVTRETLFVSILEQGSWFGAAALFNGREAYPSTLTALCPCEALLFSQETVSGLLARWPAAGVNYIRYLSGRICFLSDRLDSLAAGSAEEKVRQFLLSSADEAGRTTVPAAGIAKALGLGRASVYRAFESLESRGIITRTGKTIQLWKQE